MLPLLYCGIGIYDSTEKSSAFVMGKKTGSNSAITSHSLLTGVEKVKEHNRNSENFNFERGNSLYMCYLTT